VTTVLFACVHNAGRSQMAAAFFNALSDPEKARAISAGTEPAEHVHPEVVDGMREVGIDLSAVCARRLTPSSAFERALKTPIGSQIGSHRLWSSGPRPKNPCSYSARRGT